MKLSILLNKNLTVLYLQVFAFFQFCKLFWSDRIKQYMVCKKLIKIIMLNYDVHCSPYSKNKTLWIKMNILYAGEESYSAYEKWHSHSHSILEIFWHRLLKTSVNHISLNALKLPNLLENKLLEQISTTSTDLAISTFENDSLHISPAACISPHPTKLHKHIRLYEIYGESH